MRKNFLSPFYGFVLMWVICPTGLWAQKNEPSKSAVSIWKQILQTLRKDTLALNEEKYIWEDAAVYFPHEDKVIREIYVEHRSFAQEINDSASKILQLGGRLLDHFHTPSRYETLLRNLYMARGDTLSPFLVADNERFIRTLPYIQEARIEVRPGGPSDSVDLNIVIKDVFAYSAQTKGIGTERQNIGASAINILGTGQLAGFNFLHDLERRPRTGWEVFYGYQNLGGSFIDLNLIYSRINPNIYDGSEDEQAFQLEFQRPLISQYKQWAGSLTIGRNVTLNNYPDYNGLGRYQYDQGIVDVWAGYNAGVRKIQRQHQVKLKKFMALRAFNYHFFEVPPQIGEQKYDQRFNSRQGLLAALTLFRQYYYKTRYVYGFGLTEDLPAGWNATLITGWYKQLDLSRPYLGLNFYRYTMSRSKDISGLYFRTGAFWQEGRIRDFAVLIGGSYLTRIIPFPSGKLRFYLRGSYATIFDRVALDPLRISLDPLRTNNIFGITGFRSDLAEGVQRLSLKAESVYFMDRKLLGFNLAPILGLEAAWLKAVPGSGQSLSGWFFAANAGLRIRHEDLNVNTIEFRLSVLPRRVDHDLLFNFTISTNLKFRYSGGYVHKPLIAELNDDRNNNIF